MKKKQHFIEVSLLAHIIFDHIISVYPKIALCSMSLVLLISSIRVYSIAIWHVIAFHCLRAYLPLLDCELFKDREYVLF